jgi:hypothetical protein
MILTMTRRSSMVTLAALFFAASVFAQKIDVQPIKEPKRDRVFRMISKDSLAIKAVRNIDDPWHFECGNGKACSVPIAVTVNTQDAFAGRTCYWTYPDVVVTNHPKAEITWTLTEVISSTGARFIDSASGDGISMHLGQKAAHFPKKTRKSDKEYGWERDHDIKGETHLFFYDIYVQHNHGGKRCDVPDPIIVNRD